MKSTPQKLPLNSDHSTLDRSCSRHWTHSPCSGGVCSFFDMHKWVFKPMISGMDLLTKVCQIIAEAGTCSPRVWIYFPKSNATILFALQLTALPITWGPSVPASCANLMLPKCAITHVCILSVQLIKPHLSGPVFQVELEDSVRVSKHCVHPKLLSISGSVIILQLNMLTQH